MSHEASTWAWAQDLPTPGEKLLLACLANGADESGVTFVGRTRLAKACCSNKATISRNMRRLEEAGFVARLGRRRANGSRTSDWTILAPLAADRGGMQNADPDTLPDDVVSIARTGKAQPGPDPSGRILSPNNLSLVRSQNVGDQNPQVKNNSQELVATPTELGSVAVEDSGMAA